MSKRRGRPSDKQAYVEAVMGMVYIEVNSYTHSPMHSNNADDLRTGLNKMTCTELSILAQRMSKMKGVSLTLPSETPAQKERLEKIEETVAND
jgi:hypothetical protein